MITVDRKQYELVHSDRKEDEICVDCAFKDYDNCPNANHFLECMRVGNEKKVWQEIEEAPARKYFVSYVAYNEDGESTSGRTGILRDNPIRDVYDILDMESKLQIVLYVPRVIITNWRPFELPE